MSEYPNLFLGPIDGAPYDEWIRQQHKQGKFPPFPDVSKSDDIRGVKDDAESWYYFDDPVTYSRGAGLTNFGPGVGKMGIPKFGNTYYFKFEVKVITPARGGHHRDGDIVVWCIPLVRVPRELQKGWPNPVEVAAKLMAEAKAVAEKITAQRAKTVRGFRALADVLQD